MPSKRRIRNGTIATPPKKLLTQTTSNNVNHLNNSNINASGGDVGLTAKQEQQLKWNNYLATLNKDQLKIECRKRGSKTSGTKTELLHRLGYRMASSPQLNDLNNHNNIGQRKSNGSATNTIGKLNHNNKGSNMANGTTGASFVKRQSPKDRERERNERSRIVLWRHPILTIKYSLLESAYLLQTYGRKLLDHKALIAFFVVVVGVLIGAYHVPGRHQLFIDIIRSNMWFIVYWVGLGVLSSVGLGTGLHTFLLYLGPHIASVTLAAYECNSLNFPQPPYPDDIICPEDIDPKFSPTLWKIMTKVRPEAFLWGAGTALGELPPYFMAKAARLSGYDPDDADDLQEFEELKKKKESGENLNILDRAKLSMEKIVERVGFLGILLCASIPNPLFDLAGITCGHFLVPFWTFFGATLIGKAIIKMHLQKIFVIIAFNESLIEKAVDMLGFVPVIGKILREPFKVFLQNQKERLHRSSKNTAIPSEKSNLLARIFEKFIIATVVYFIISIVNSLAQNYHKRIHKKGGKVYRKLSKD